MRKWCELDGFCDRWRGGRRRGFLQLHSHENQIVMWIDNASTDEKNIPKIMTLVVPSPTSSSWVRLSSIMLFAAGWVTSISRKMAFPSLVNTMPPMGSKSIFNIARGPRHVRMMSDTVYRDMRSKRPNTLAAEMLDNWALRPVSRWKLVSNGERYDEMRGNVLMTMTGACILAEING